MPRFTDEQRALLQASMTARADVLRQEISGKLKRPGASQGMALENYLEGIDDEAVASLESALDIAEVERDLAELRGLRLALARVETTELGVCNDCGADIPFERLSAQLDASRCVACQSRAERAKGGIGRASL